MKFQACNLKITDEALKANYVPDSNDKTRSCANCEFYADGFKSLGISEICTAHAHIPTYLGLCETWLRFEQNLDDLVTVIEKSTPAEWEEESYSIPAHENLA